MNATYTCEQGGKLQSGKLNHVATCMEDGTWKPALDNDICLTVQKFCFQNTMPNKIHNFWYL